MPKRSQKSKSEPYPIDRKPINNFLHKSPGASFRGIARNVDIPRDRLRKELEDMVKDQEIARFRFRNRDCHFPNKKSYTNNWEKVMLLAQMDGMRDLYEFVIDHPNVNQKEILTWTARKRWKRSTSQWRIKQLVQHGLVNEKPKGREVYYRATGKVPAALKK